MSPDTAVAVRQDTALAPIREALKGEGGALHAFLPSEAQRQRFLRLVMTAVQDNPDLLRCRPDTIAAAAVEAASLGLEPSGAIGGAHIVPFRSTAQLIVDYRGLIELARRSERIEDAFANVARKLDVFEYDAAAATVRHVPNLDSQAVDPDDAENPVTHFYACVVHTSGYRRFVVMSRADVDRIRAMAPGGNSPAWRVHYVEMGKKTVLRLALKTAPLSPQAREFIAREDAIVAATVEPVPAAAPARLADRLRARVEPTQADEANEQPPAAEPAAEASRETSPVGGSSDTTPPAAPEQDTAAAASESAPTPSPEPTVAREGARQSVPSLDELVRAPSRSTFEAYVGEVLDAGEAVPLKDLVSADVDQVIATMTEPLYVELYPRLPAIVKATLRGLHQAPSDRKRLATVQEAEERIAAAAKGGKA